MRKALRQAGTDLARTLATEAARPRRIANWRYAPWLAVGTVCFGAFMGQLDASIVTLTFPALSSRFHSSLASVQWVSLGYLLTLVALLAAVGRLADTFGRKQLYLCGFALFTLASAACGLAPTLGTLIGCRVCQALGAAMLQANSVALVTTSVPVRRMRAALGVQAAAQALGLALGPTLGGLLVEQLGWRWVFWVNVPVGVLGLVAGRYLLPRTRQRSAAGTFDWAGLALLAVSSTALLLAVSSVSGLRLPGGLDLALLVAGLLTGGGFVARERRAGTPLVDLRLLRDRAVGGGLLAALGGYLLLFGPLVLVPVTLTSTLHSTLRAGLVITVLPLGFGLAAMFGGRLVPAGWSNRRRGMTGAAVCVLALAVLTVVPPVVTALLPALFVVGLGLGLFTPPNNAVVMGAIPTERSGVGGGLLNMARGLGTALGVAMVTFTLHEAGARWAFGMLAITGVLVVLAASVAGPGRGATIRSIAGAEQPAVPSR